MSKGGRRQAAWTSASTLALAALLGGTGCLRFAYREVEHQDGPTHDAGMDAGASHNMADASSQMDAQRPAAGSGGGPGTGGRSASGTGGTGQIIDASVDASDAALADAGVLNDAGSQDAAVPAAGSGGAGSGGAGSGGAGSGAAGSGGAGGSVAFASCAQANGVVFCDGFEEARPWTPTPYDYDIITNGSEQRSTSRKYFGAASAHMSTTSNATGTTARIASRDLNGKKSGDIWLRYYYYVPNSVTISTYFSAGVMSEIAPPYKGFSLLIHNSSVEIESALIANKTATYTFPRGRWVCVELHALIDASNGYFEAFTDSALRVQTNTGNSVPDSGFTSAEVGIHYVGSNQGSVDVYVDNVVVSTARYGCDL